MTSVTGPTGFQYVAPSGPSTVPGAGGVDSVGGAPGQPVVVDGAPPPPDRKTPTVQADGLPPPTMDRSQARAEFARISTELDQFDFSQPMDVSSLAQVIQLRDQLAAMFLKLRSDDLKNRDDELQTMVTQRLAGVDKGLEAAAKDLVAGLINGFATVAAGALSMTGGIKGMRAAGGTGLDAGVDAAARVGANIQAMNQAFAGGSQMIQGLGSIGAAFVTYGAKQDEADKARYDVTADTANTRMGQAGERASNWLELLRAYVQAQQQQISETTGAFTRAFS
jgi:hypothetical protein